jgi:hypothetical protein
MTKRINQPSTVVVPANVAHAPAGAAPASKASAAVVAAEAAKAGKADVVADKDAAPAANETVIAAAAPAPLAMVDAAVTVDMAQDTATTTTATDDDEADDATPYIVGGVLLAGGILAVALSGGEDDTILPAPTPAPTPTPTPTNTVTISTAATATVAENVAAGATGVDVLDVNATANGAAPTFALSGPDAALFTINSTTGEIRFVGSPNFEATPTKTTFNVTVTASSAASGNIPAATATQNVVITLTNVNEAPTFANATATVSVPENTSIATAIITGGATDPDANSTVTYSLTGADAALFAVNAQTGAVTFRASPDFEATPTRTSFTFNLVATDNATPALSSSQAVTVNLTNVNEAPTVTVPTTAVAFAENQAVGTTVFTATSADADAGATRTLSLTGPDAALFAINQTTGAVTFVASPNFEATPTRTTFTVSVVSTDQAGLATTSAPVTINLTNVNEAPTFAAATQAVTVAENTAIATAVATATATDPDAGTTLTYSLTGADAALFTVSPTGVVTFRASPDFENPGDADRNNVYLVSVVASDGGNAALTATQAITVTVTDVPEGVVLVGTQNLSAAGANVQYIESASTANTSTITGFGNGDTITVDVATSNYSFTNNGADLVISFANNGVVNQITLVGAVNANSVIFNEFTAEQAVGSNFFLPGANVPVPPAAANTIDGAGALATYDAANAGVTYTENAGAANTTTINNFGTDDRIVVQGAAAGSYSFTSNATDIIITFANNGIVNQITLAGASRGQVVFNEATAEAAVGADFFRYA